MSPTDDLADLLGFLDDEGCPDEETQPTPAVSTEPEQPAHTTDLADDLLEDDSSSDEEAQPAPAAIIPGPSVLTEGLVERMLADLRKYRIVTGAAALRVLEAVELMLTRDPHHRVFGACLIKKIARKVGLDVVIRDDPTALSST